MLPVVSCQVLCLLFFPFETRSRVQKDASSVSLQLGPRVRIGQCSPQGVFFATRDCLLIFAKTRHPARPHVAHREGSCRTLYSQLLSPSGNLWQCMAAPSGIYRPSQYLRHILLRCVHTICWQFESMRRSGGGGWLDQFPRRGSMKPLRSPTASPRPRHTDIPRPGQTTNGSFLVA